MVGNSHSVICKAKIAKGYFRRLWPECLCGATKPIRVPPSSLPPGSPSPAPHSSAVCQAASPADCSRSCRAAIAAERQHFPDPFFSCHQGWARISGLGRAVTLAWCLPVHWDFSSPKLTLQYFQQAIRIFCFFFFLVVFVYIWIFKK